MSTLNTDEIRSLFQQKINDPLELGASLSIWQGASEICTLWGGYADYDRTIPWNADTLVLVWSVTKGISATCVLRVVDQAQLNLDTRVSHFWPEFAGGGKGGITIGEVLSHRSGLVAPMDTHLSLLDYDAVRQCLEKQTPFWQPDGTHGYGARTFGIIVDEVVRRLTGGTPLGKYWREELADPLGIDFWIGLPEELHSRVATMVAPRPGMGEMNEDFAEAMANPKSLTRRVFPDGFPSPATMNFPAVRSASLPSLGGIGSAQALAKYYGILANGGNWANRTWFSRRALHWMETMLTTGVDRIFRIQTAFSAGLMKDPVDSKGHKLRQTFGPSLRAFGHPGAGGCLAFADPENQIGFAYVLNQMHLGVFPGARVRPFVDILYRSVPSN